MLPLGFRIRPAFDPVSSSEKSALRAQLGLPDDRLLVLSVAALDRSVKRLDYVIREIASLPQPRPFLVLAGEAGDETEAVRALAHRCLGDDGFDMRTVPPGEVERLYRSCDVLVLASLFECLPRALIEASASGLPCLAHAYPITEFALGPHGYYADLSREGALAGLLSCLGESDFSASAARKRHGYAYEQFSWDRLRGRYVKLLREVAGWSPDIAPATAGGELVVQ